MKTIIAIVLVLGALGLAPLTIGAFAHANPDFGVVDSALTSSNPYIVREDGSADIPQVVRDLVSAIRNLEGGISGALLPNLRSYPFERGFAYMGLTVLLTAIASALLADTRSQTIQKPGRKAA
ncbi:MAG: hypothetical protein ACK41E_05555 [Deinococcales bacterium]